MSRVLLLTIAVAGLLAIGFGAQDSAARRASLGRPFAQGDVVLAGDGVFVLPAGQGSPIQLDSPGVGAAGAAFDGTGILNVAINPPSVRIYEPDGSSTGGRYGSWPDEDQLTAEAEDPRGDVYIASSDHLFDHEIMRFTAPARETGNPLLVPAEVTAMTASSDGCTLIEGGTDGWVRRYNWCRRSEEAPVLHGVQAVGLRLAPDGTILIAASGSPSIERVTANGRHTNSYTAPGVSNWSALDLSPSGDTLWAATATGDIYRFDLASGGIVAGPIRLARKISGIAVDGAAAGGVPDAAAGIVPRQVQLDGVPVLTGEVIAGNEAGRPDPPAGCDPSGVSTLNFSTAAGSSTAPYEGQFVFGVTATGSLGPQTQPGSSGPLGLPPGLLASLTGTFAGQTANGALTGHFEASQDPTNTGLCSVFTSRSFDSSRNVPSGYPLTGYFTDARAPQGRYDAKISRAGREYFDTGAAHYLAWEYFLRGPDGRLQGRARRTVLEFQSDRAGALDTFTNQTRQRTHSLVIGPTTRRIQLVVRWTDLHTVLRLADIRLDGRALTRSDPSAPGKLKIVVHRTRTAVTASISNLRPGRLSFGINAVHVSSPTVARTEASATT